MWTGAAIKTAGNYETLLENALALDPSSEAYKLANGMRSGALHANDINVGQLFASYAEAGGDLGFMTASTEETAIKVGQATILKVPYTGETPVQGVKMERNTPYISSALVDRAQTMIANAASEAQMGRGAFKNLLTRAYEAIFKVSKHVEVEGLAFRGEPYYVDINKGVPAKVISDVNHSPEKLALLEILPDIVKNGEYVGSTVGKKNAIRYDHFETAVTIHEGPYLVLFETEVYPGANNYKTHRLISMELAPQTDGVTGTPPAPSAEAPTPYAERVPQTTDGVKPGYPQLSNGQPQDPAQQLLALAGQRYNLLQWEQAPQAQLAQGMTQQQLGQYFPQLEAIAWNMVPGLQTDGTQSAQLALPPGEWDGMQQLDPQGLAVSEPGTDPLKKPVSFLEKTLEVDFEIVKGIIPKGAEIGKLRLIAGGSSGTPVRVAQYFSELYGGAPLQWIKMGGIITTDNFCYDVHWFELNGRHFEEKIKGVKRR